jgi:hypothetical protein
VGTYVINWKWSLSLKNPYDFGRFVWGTGRGVDRHLLGLRCMMTQEEAANAAIFADPSYSQSMYFKLSTSNTSPGDFSWGGFGPVVPEGYGSNYAIGKERIRLSISSWNTAPETNAASFRATLKNVFNDLAEAVERA